MNVTVKLYASLGQYLPPGARDNVAAIDLDTGATPQSVIEKLRVPQEQCHLVLVNGTYVPPGERASTPLTENDAVAVWPPIAGG